MDEVGSGKTVNALWTYSPVSRNLKKCNTARLCLHTYTPHMQTYKGLSYPTFRWETIIACEERVSIMCGKERGRTTRREESFFNVFYDRFYIKKCIYKICLWPLYLQWLLVMGTSAVSHAALFECLLSERQHTHRFS